MAEETVPQESITPGEKRKVTPLVWIGVALVVLTAGLLAGLYFLPDDLRTRFRDVSIVFIAILVFLAMLVGLALLTFLIVALNRLSDRLDILLSRGTSILEKVEGTATTVKGTTDFVGEQVASPFIRVAGWLSGLAEGTVTFFRGHQKEVRDE